MHGIIVEEMIDSDAVPSGTQSDGFERSGLTLFSSGQPGDGGDTDHVVGISCTRSTANRDRAVPIPSLGRNHAEQVTSTARNGIGIISI